MRKMIFVVLIAAVAVAVLAACGSETKVVKHTQAIHKSEPMMAP